MLCNIPVAGAEDTSEAGTTSDADYTYSVTDFGADGSDSTDDTKAFVSVFDMAKTSDEMVTITIPAGTYYISQAISVFSNTTVIAEEGAVIKATFTTSPTGNAMLVGRHMNDDGTICTGSSCQHGGHSQTQNVIIQGGVWDRNDLKGEANSSIFSFRHASNITIKDLTVKNATSHMINLSGVDNALVTNVIFQDSIKYTGTDESYWAGYTPGDDTRYGSIEVLHLDFMNFEDEPNTYPADNTPPENVTVTGCTFKNVFAGIGTHHLNSGERGNNFTITNNTFTNLNGTCINIYDYDNVTITGNKADTGLVFVYSARSNAVISSNTVNKMSGCSIYLTNQATGTVSNNTITNSGAASIRAHLNCNLTVSNNTITGTDDTGISATSSCTMVVKNNTIKTAATNGIRIDTSSITASGNVISGVTGNGIYLINVTGGTITSNQISSSTHGITLGTSTTCSVSSNIIKNITSIGLFVNGGKGNIINKNNVSVATLGIYVDGAASCTITGNSVTGCSSHALYLKGASSTSTCTASATGNVFTSTSASVKNIRLVGYCKGCTVSNNTIGAGGIAADSTCTYKASSNILNTLAKPAIKLANSASGISVSWNKVTGASGYYIFRRVSGGSWTAVGRVSNVNTLNYIDTTAAAGKVYAYTVRAYVTQGSYVYYSNYNTTGVGIIRLTQPGLYTPENTAAGVKVSWTKVAGAQGYNVYRRTAGGSWCRVGTVTGGSILSYTDTTAAAGTSYAYTVRAYYKTYVSSYSAAGKGVKRLKTPTAAVSAVKGKINVKWTKTAGAQGYYIYRKTASGSWIRIATIKSGSTLTYADTTVKAGTKYYYAIKAYYGGYMSAWSNLPYVTAK